MRFFFWTLLPIYAVSGAGWALFPDHALRAIVFSCAVFFAANLLGHVEALRLK